MRPPTRWSTSIATIAGEHPDWDEYRAAMVADGRLVLSLAAERAYGFA